MSAHLRFAPDVLQRLGEDFNPSPEQGILELIRNAYDADASTCVVQLTRVGRRGGTLTITDDGIGMGPNALRDSWLVLGRSSKDSVVRTPRFGRLTVGSKGLGRLAALRLGQSAEIRTRPTTKPGVEYSVVFDWSASGARTVDEVALEITRSATDEPPGTTIRVSLLQRAFTKAEVRRLAPPCSSLPVRLSQRARSSRPSRPPSSGKWSV